MVARLLGSTYSVAVLGIDGGTRVFLIRVLRLTCCCLHFVDLILLSWLLLCGRLLTFFVRCDNGIFYRVFEYLFILRAVQVMGICLVIISFIGTCARTSFIALHLLLTGRFLEIGKRLILVLINDSWHGRHFVELLRGTGLANGFAIRVVLIERIGRICGLHSFKFLLRPDIDLGTVLGFFWRCRLFLLTVAVLVHVDLLAAVIDSFIANRFLLLWRLLLVHPLHILDYRLHCTVCSLLLLPVLLSLFLLFESS